MNRCTYRVIYGDTDQMGVVYYANYLAFFERGRCEYMRERAFAVGGLLSVETTPGTGTKVRLQLAVKEGVR